MVVMARPANANAEETRRKILQVASELFARNGEDGVSVRTIASSCKLSVAMVNHYFGSKHGLYEACIDQMYIELAKLKNTAPVLAIGIEVKDWVPIFTTALHIARQHRFTVTLLLRQVLDHGAVEPERFARDVIPSLNLVVDVLEAHSELHGCELRFAVQGVVHALTRFSLANPDEMRSILEKPSLSDDEILAEAARHLSHFAMRALALRTDTITETQH